MNRRSFFSQALGALCLAERGAAKTTPSERRLTNIGLQLYTVRRELATDFDGTLAKVAALGFRAVEFAGYHERAPGQVKAALVRHRLAAPSAHVTTSALRGQLREPIEAAKTVGHEYLVCGYVPAEERRTLDDYKKLADLLNRSGEQMKKSGIQFCYHNHDFEFERVGGEIPYDLLLARTDARLVRMELDLYWITKAGHDPLDYFPKHEGRFPLVHVKDMDGTPRRFFTEAGRGVIDFKRIFAAAAGAGVKHYFVEQDETPASPFESIRVSMDYLKRLRF